MITKGQKVNEISEQLNLSPKTVNSYRYRMFSKLNIHGDVELTHGHSPWFVQCGVVNKSVSEAFDSKAFLKTVTSQPGVYRMYDAGGTVIYVGKAKDLKNAFPAISAATLPPVKPKRWSHLYTTLMSP